MNLLRSGKLSLAYVLLFLVVGLRKYAVAFPLALKEKAASGGFPAPAEYNVILKNPSNFSYYSKLLISAFLVLLGGVFAGLTIGLMGCDEVYLQVLEQSGDEYERKHANKVLGLLNRGKHWVLVTLLLGNVIVNETLPIVFDSIIGGGWPAVLISTGAIVIFGEVIPQALCVRYGLSIGAKLEPLVLFMMYLLMPIAYPTALLLDACLGEDHGTMYRKAGLKTLVTLHRDLGLDKLNQDEVTIITAVLDLREKSAKSIMTPIENVFTLPTDRVVDEQLIGDIICAGYSRIPVHRPGFPHDFIGMLLTKTLIGYDPDDCWPVSRFALATLPQTFPDTSCLDLLNYCQEGKSHMILISDHPGEKFGTLGVITLEDIIEELIGEEIIDETDVYIDVHKGLPRVTYNNEFWDRLFHRSHLNTMAALTKSRLTATNGETHTDDQRPILNPRNAAMNPRYVPNERVKVKTPVSIKNETSYGSMEASNESVASLSKKVGKVETEIEAHSKSIPTKEEHTSEDISQREVENQANEGDESHDTHLQHHRESNASPIDYNKIAERGFNQMNNKESTKKQFKSNVDSLATMDRKTDSGSSVSEKTFTGKRVRLGNVIESNLVSADGIERIVIEPYERTANENSEDIVEMVERNGILVPKVSITNSDSHEENEFLNVSDANTPSPDNHIGAVSSRSSKNKKKKRKNKNKK
ncbi:multi-pass membrane and CBS domain protein [Schizosaccharomyces osmophilus]|uniref:Multi-pass membrane and CBS domain protein n=1 Tax=Schizosaccharomyces osmophilus TaxID=2545709 RepID=A0AAE9WHB9_9SCHI|nr:multi-pass membrane and CBS domain protein [Schizosaccharomyces osmophilus]WBW74886.1 multi-pass membrane and CBS domain protein [Schizosaccharomyces osmophilus]